VYDSWFEYGVDNSTCLVFVQCLVETGIVILMLDSKMESGVAKDMIKGAPDTMYSEFHLGYNMLLNLLRIEGCEPEQLMAASFRQFQVSLRHGYNVGLAATKA
jgi:superfamily II RNA helicase